MPVNIFELN